MSSIRYACRRDAGLILSFIKALAEFEHLEHEVVADEELLVHWLFDQKKAEVLLAVNDEGREVGMALFFHNFSTFLGRAGIYLEDLFVLPEYRRQGFGRMLLQKLAAICVERGCGRLEWSCLKWNENALKFYRSKGARTLDEWVTLRVTGRELAELAGTRVPHGGAEA